MRKSYYCFIFILAMLLTSSIFSQQPANSDTSPNSSLLYLGIGGGRAFPGKIAGTSISFIQPKKLGYSLKYNINYAEAKSLPSNYVIGFCIFGNCIPTDEYHSVSVLLIKEFPTSSTLFRFGIEAGPSAGIYHKAYFKYKSGGGGWFGSNYSTYHTKTGSIGLSLRAKFVFSFATFAGLEVAVSSNINIHQPFAGIELYLMLGKVRERFTPKTKPDHSIQRSFI